MEVFDLIFDFFIVYIVNFVVLVWCDVGELDVLVGKVLFYWVGCVICYMLKFVIVCNVLEL